jgi:hypothetical protein
MGSDQNSSWSSGGTSGTFSHAGRGPKGYHRSDDRILEEVNEALKQDHDIDASDLEAQISKGEVTLTGTVCSRREKRMAEEVVESVSGVENVQNQIRVVSRAEKTSSSSSEQGSSSSSGSRQSFGQSSAGSSSSIGSGSQSVGSSGKQGASGTSGSSTSTSQSR